MFGFVARKTLYDVWDNIASCALMNICGMAGSIVCVFLLRKLAPHPIFFPAAAMLTCFLAGLYCAAAAHTAKSIADRADFELIDCAGYLREDFAAGLCGGGFLALLFFIALKLVPAFSRAGLFGLFVFCAVFWLAIAACHAAQFFFAASLRSGNRSGAGLLANIKKTVGFFLHGPLFCGEVLVVCAGIFAVSLIFFLIFPGITGIYIFLDNAWRIRSIGYDWLEKNSADVSPAKIPWDDLLAEERESVGKRSLRRLLFPWKR